MSHGCKCVFCQRVIIAPLITSDEMNLVYKIHSTSSMTTPQNPRQATPSLYVIIVFRTCRILSSSDISANLACCWHIPWQPPFACLGPDPI